MHVVTTPRERLPYSPITARPPLPPLPDAARIIVWTVVNVEVWDIGRPMPRTVLAPPQGKPLLPDVANWSWHEYGMRVGFWRFVQTLNRFGIRATLAINGSVCKSYPRVAKAALEAGWEFMGVRPSRLRMRGSAPAASRRCTSRASPSAAATCSSVFPKGPW